MSATAKATLSCAESGRSVSVKVVVDERKRTSRTRGPAMLLALDRQVETEAGDRQSAASAGVGLGGHLGISTHVGVGVGVGDNTDVGVPVHVCVRSGFRRHSCFSAGIRSRICVSVDTSVGVWSCVRVRAHRDPIVSVWRWVGVSVVSIDTRSHDRSRVGLYTHSRICANTHSRVGAHADRTPEVGSNTHVHERTVTAQANKAERRVEDVAGIHSYAIRTDTHRRVDAVPSDAGTRTRNDANGRIHTSADAGGSLRHWIGDAGVGTRDRVGFDVDIWRYDSDVGIWRDHADVDAHCWVGPGILTCSFDGANEGD